MSAYAKWGLVAVMLLSVAGIACGGDDKKTGKHDIWFMGAVIDGATGAPVTTYDISLVYGSTTVKGKVDANGRYVLGPLPAWNDYGVLIEGAAGYRPFSSYNSFISPPAPPTTSLSADIYSADTRQTFNFNAYLFPTALTAPDLSIAIVEAGTTPTPLSGSISLQPTAGTMPGDMAQPSILPGTSEVGNQVWDNDRDLFAGSISGTFTNGTFMAPSAMLVYGVKYRVQVYGVEDFQPGSGLVQAGVTSGVTVTLARQMIPDLQLLSNTASSCRPPTALTDTTSAQVTFTFNEEVEDGTTSTGGAAEVLDNGLTVSFNLFLSSSMASNSSPTIQERGVTVVANANTLNLSWNPNVGVAIKGVGDSVIAFTYNSLGAVFVQPKGHPTQRVQLSQLFPQFNIQCRN